MLWLVVLASHSSHADDSPTPLAEASALSAPQRRDLPADTTAKDAATKPPRDSASPDAPSVWDIAVSGGCHDALGGAAGSTYEMQGTTASGAPY